MSVIVGDKAIVISKAWKAHSMLCLYLQLSSQSEERITIWSEVDRIWNKFIQEMNVFKDLIYVKKS